MPCGDGDTFNTAKLAELKEKLDEVTDLLCDTCRRLEDKMLLGKIHMKTLNWWKIHKRQDAERIKREKEDEERLYKLDLERYKELKRKLGL